MVDRYFSNIIGAQIIRSFVFIFLQDTEFDTLHSFSPHSRYDSDPILGSFHNGLCVCFSNLSLHSFKLWVFNLCPFLLCMILLRHVKMNSLRHRHLTFVLSIFLTVLLVWLSPTLPSCMVFILLSSFVFPCPCQWSCSFMIFWIIRFPFIVCNCMILWFWNFPEVVLFIVHDAYKIQWLVC